MMHGNSNIKVGNMVCVDGIALWRTVRDMAEMLIQSRWNNTFGYLRRVVLWPAVKAVNLVT